MKINFIVLALGVALCGVSASAAKVDRHCTYHTDANGVRIKNCTTKAKVKHNGVKRKFDQECREVTNPDGSKVRKCDTMMKRP